MKQNAIVLIASEAQQNIGAGYLTSFLHSKGFKAKIVDWDNSLNAIIDSVKEIDPFLVGFSLIFQYHFSHLKILAKRMREDGIHCHFTVGGHYPSFRYDTILDYSPEIDSVVRYEGEITLMELVRKITDGSKWNKIAGLAYRENGKPVSNELRPLINNLDSLPFPYRSDNRDYKCMGVKCAFILGSRGCYRNCSFCSIRAFYGAPPGKLRRTRSVGNVIDEIEILFREKDVRIFLFQDDDFFSPGKDGKDWACAFLEELDKRELTHKNLWKINCRPDEIETDLFKKMKDAGLFLVYLGIESGNPLGLKTMNKLLSVQDNIDGVNKLKQIKLDYEYGFMLFDPLSTFDSIKQNIDFLRKLSGDGSSTLTFCKMLPYAGTTIEKQLRVEGRLKGGIDHPDYDFLDPRIDHYFNYVFQTFDDYMNVNGFSADLKWHGSELAVLRKFYCDLEGFNEHLEKFIEIRAASNNAGLEVLEDSLYIFENKAYSSTELEFLTESLSSKYRALKEQLLISMGEFRAKQVSNS